MKKLIALAIAALPAAAMADVVIYGEAGAALENTKTTIDGKSNGSVTGVENYNSKIGFKGSEDLGNGLNADSTPSGHPVRSHLARHSTAIWPPVPRPSGRAVGAQRRRGGIVSPGWLASSISASVCALIHPSD